LHLTTLELITKSVNYGRKIVFLGLALGLNITKTFFFSTRCGTK
jgi:hypothetical protein